MNITKAQIAQIRRLLSKSPDDKYRQRGLTGDQLAVWISHRALNELVAQCWKALHSTGNNPLPDLVDSGAISRVTSDLCWLKTQAYKYLWELIFLSGRDLKEVAARLELSYPFDSGLEFFEHIIQKEASAHFEVCLQPYVEVSSQKYETKLRKALKADELPKLGPKPTDAHFKKVVDHFGRKPGRDYWTTFAWCVWDVLAISRRDIRWSLAAYDDVLAEMAKLQAKGLREVESIAWKKGQKGIGQKGGFYHFPDEPFFEAERLEAHFDLNQGILPQICDIS